MRVPFTLSGSLRGRMALLFLAFVLLVFVSAAATAWTVGWQAQDALTINLAGRQRMLVQQMTVHALLIEKGGGQEQIQALQQAAAAFDQTLEALSAGGTAPYLPGQTVEVPAPPSPEIRAALEQEREGWEALRPLLELIAAEQPGTPRFTQAIESLERATPPLVQRADEVVRLYEAASARKIARLRWIQGIFLMGALGLLAAGFILIRRSVLNPLESLSAASTRIGSGDLSTAVIAASPAEIHALAYQLDAMRVQLREAREDLEAQVVRRTRELAALYEVSQEISSHLETNHVLDSVTGKASELLDSDVAFLCLLDDTSHSLELRAYRGADEAAEGLHVSIEQSSVERVLAAQSAVSCVGNGCHGPCRIISAPFRASHQAVPLRVGDQPIGALCVGRAQPGGFSADEARLLTKLGQSAAIALENARLYQQAEQVAALEERQRIAADMHDGLAQILSYLEIKTEHLAEAISAGDQGEALSELDHIRRTLSEANQDVRRSIAHLHDISVPRKAFADRLAELVNDLGQPEAPRIDFSVPSGCPVVLPPEQTEQVLRVVGEALQNARRHAAASTIRVSFEQEGHLLALRIEDDGCGFDPGVPLQEAGHFGLSIMRARAARLGGTLTLESAPGQGTRVRLMWPAPNGRPSI